MHYILGFNTFYFFVHALLNNCLGILINVVKYTFYCLTNTAIGHGEIPVIAPRLLSWLITEGTNYPRGKVAGL